MNKRWLFGIAALGIIVAGGLAWAANTACNIDNCMEQGGARWSIGGSLDVLTGGDLDMESGSTFKLAGTTVSASAAELNLTDGLGSTTAELDAYVLSTCIADVSTAQSDWIVAPHAGDILGIWTVIDGAIATADAVITLELGGTLVTGSTITIANSSSAAGDIDTGTGTAANAVAAGGAIEVITSGASTNTVEVCVSMLIDR